MPYKITKTSLELQDHTEIMLNDVTLTPIEDLFTLNKKEILPYEFKDQVWISVTIEMDLILKTYERTGYTLFDLLSDIGGLSGILMTFFTSFMAIWNYNSLDNLLVQSLFKTNKEDKERNGEFIKNSAENVEYIKLSNYPNCKDLLWRILPRSCRRYIKPRRRDLILEKARQKLQVETNIIDLVQQKRYLKHAIKELLPKEKR